MADHVGTQKCAWSTAEMKVNFFQIFYPYYLTLEPFFRTDEGHQDFTHGVCWTRMYNQTRNVGQWTLQYYYFINKCDIIASIAQNGEFYMHLWPTNIYRTLLTVY